MWFFFALASAVLYAFRGILEKGAVAKTNKYILGLAVRLFALPFFVVPFLINPQLFVPVGELPGTFWVAILVVSLISTPLETVFYYKALKEEELSLALPILSLSPVLTLGFAALLFGEYPTLIGAVGVLTILFGVYALKIGHAKNGLLEPLLHLSKSRGVQFMVIVAVSLALGSIFDKMGVQAAGVYMYALFNYLTVSITLFAMAWLRARQHFGQLLTHFKIFAVIGIVVAGYTLFYLLALDIGNTAYVVAIRNASILISIILAVVWLKEKDLRTKLVAGACIFIGLVLIKVLG